MKHRNITWTLRNHNTYEKYFHINMNSLNSESFARNNELLIQFINTAKRPYCP